MLSRLPHESGVYLYRNSGLEIIYVGKARDLRNRVQQYFDNSPKSPKTQQLVKFISQVDIITTVNEFDALLLEANLIYKHLPKYNVIAKDDKSPLYIRLTLSEQLPRVQLVRKTHIRNHKADDAVFGPFQSARIATSMLKSIRRIIPFCTQKARNGQPCFYTHINLCNPCASYVSGLTDSPEKRNLTRMYRKNILRIKSILSGKSRILLSELQKLMETAADRQQYEQAGLYRDQIKALFDLIHRKYDPQVYLQTAEFNASFRQAGADSLVKELNPFYPGMTKIEKIECIDISNLGGTHASGSLVTFVNGASDKSQYRRFRIRTKDYPNDYKMIAEVVNRRFSHPEWPRPDILVIDGGKGQVSSAREQLAKMEISQTVIGLAKREEEIVAMSGDKFHIIRLPLSSPALRLLQSVRDEAHRFALSYHHKLIRKDFLPEKH